MMIVNANAEKTPGVYSPDILLDYKEDLCHIVVKNKDEKDHYECVGSDLVTTFLSSDLNDLKGNRVYGLVMIYHNDHQKLKPVIEIMKKLSIPFNIVEMQFENTGVGRRISVDNNNQTNNKLTVSPKFKFETRKNKRILIKHEHLSLGDDFKGGFDILNLLTVNYHGWLSQVQDAVKDLVPGDIVVLYLSGFDLNMREAINNIASYTPKPTVLQYRIEDGKVSAKFVLSLMGNLRDIEVTEADMKFFGEIKDTLKKDMYFDPFA